MTPKFLRVLLFLLVPVSLLAQQPKVLLITPFSVSQLEYRPVRKILKKNNVTVDSLINHINTKYISSLTHLMSETEVMMADTHLIHLLNDSSEIEEMFTSSHLEKINEAKGFKKLQRFNQNENDVRYYGRHVRESVKYIVQQELIKNKVDYFVVLNKIALTGNSKTGFAVHFEIYDQQLNRVYGNKFYQFMSTSNKMYFSTFLYYLDYSLEGFVKRLVNTFPELKKPANKS